MQIETKPHIGRKIIATLIDYGLTFAVFSVYVRYFGEYDPNENSHSVHGWLSLPILFYWLIYHVVIEYSVGNTLGHFVVGLRVTNFQGEQTNFSQNLKRHLLDFFDIFMWGIPAIIAIKNTDKNQRLGDLWAKTIVIKPDNVTPEKTIE
jgi:uncharacterized RDD family membrane protein YckC